MKGIKIEHELWEEPTFLMSFVKLTMTNARGTQYVTHVFKDDFGSKRGPLPSRVKNVVKRIDIRTCHAPKWVQRTIEEHMPIAAILLS